jgi:hypothetical protein
MSTRMTQALILLLALVVRLPKLLEQARLWDEMRRRERRLSGRDDC